ncbi:hypothetical protein FNF27_05279 [Cafeteria roenbergensis]|uniref:Uncharacterized protein n=1 Tax=Cafeteria roenbergensis TaxID=33653 RepID=A0A5A8EBA5_CAFRO|nr:hypothetical protein FNF27_05279 [Cafeteria roenbergensis]
MLRSISEFFSPTHAAPSSSPLDISKVTDRLYVMGLPWRRMTEATAQRNNIDEIAAHLRAQFGNHALLFDLTSRGPHGVDYSKFNHQVLHFEPDFSDRGHEDVPAIRQAFSFCYAAKFWTELHPRNVVVLFCKDGRRRSGFFAACWLAYSGVAADTMEGYQIFTAARLRGNIQGTDARSAAARAMRMRALPDERRKLRLLRSWAYLLVSTNTLLNQIAARPVTHELVKIIARFSGAMEQPGAPPPVVEVLVDGNPVFYSDEVYVRGDVCIRILTEQRTPAEEEREARALEAPSGLSPVTPSLSRPRIAARFAFHSSMLPALPDVVTHPFTADRVDLHHVELSGHPDKFSLHLILGPAPLEYNGAGLPEELGTAGPKADAARRLAASEAAGGSGRTPTPAASSADASGSAPLVRPPAPVESSSPTLASLVNVRDFQATRLGMMVVCFSHAVVPQESLMAAIVNRHRFDGDTVAAALQLTNNSEEAALGLLKDGLLASLARAPQFTEEECLGTAYGAAASMSSRGASPPRSAALRHRPKAGAEPSLSGSQPGADAATPGGAGAPEAGPDAAGGVPLGQDPAYAPFFKMLKVGVPRPAVEIKVREAGLDPAALDADQSKPFGKPTAAGAGGAPAAGPDAAGGVPLGQDPAYAPFFKMLKVGVPRPAVEIKVREAGLDPAALDADQSKPFGKPTAAGAGGAGAPAAGPDAAGGVPLGQDPAYAPFFKMLKVGVPRPAVEIKVREAGLDPAALDADQSKPFGKPTAAGAGGAPAAGPDAAGGVPLGQDPAYAPFFKMLKVGVPRPAVEIKVREAGLDPAALDADQSKPFGKPTAADAEPADPEAVPIKEHPEYGPFVKMLRLRVPRPAIENKMRVQGLDSAVLDLDPEEILPKRFRKSSKPAAAAASSHAKAKSSVIRKRLHWDELPEDRLAKTSFWDQVASEAREAGQSGVDIDSSDYEALFTKKKGAPSKPKPAAGAAAAGATKVRLVEFKRATNVGIGLARISMGTASVRACLRDLTCYAPDGKSQLSTADLHSLVDLVPTNEEVRTVMAFKGPRSQLGEAEAFFAAMADVKKPKARAMALHYQRQRHGSFDGVKVIAFGL